MTVTKNHFETLGIKPGATEDDVKKAYRGMAKKFHPDKNDDAGAEEKFKEISAAYEYLKSEDRREVLARDLNRPKHSETPSTSFFTYSQQRTSAPGNFESDWSKKYGKESETRYKDSSFGSFADDGKESHRSKEKKTKQKAQKKKQQTPQNSSRQRRPWTYERATTFDDSDFFDIPPPPSQPRPNFSFAFKSFVDDIGSTFESFFMGHPTHPGTFEFSAFFDGTDPFDPFSRQGMY